MQMVERILNLHWDLRIKLFLLYSVCYLFLYIVPNFYPFFDPIPLVLTPIDRMVPFLPWTFVIYLSLYGMPLSLVLILDNDTDLIRYATWLLMALTLCGMFFIFMPTSYPRPHIDQSHNEFIRLFTELVWRLDSPNNCFPSMHVASVCVGVCAVYKRKILCRIFSVWALLIILSTLTTKQHYVLDIVGGALTAGFAVALERKYVASSLTKLPGLKRLFRISSQS